MPRSLFVFRFSVSVSAPVASLTCSCCRQLRNLLHVPANVSVCYSPLPPSLRPTLLLLRLPATEGCTLTGIKSTFYKLTTIFHKNIQNCFANTHHTSPGTFCCHAHAHAQARAARPRPVATGCISICISRSFVWHF